MVSHFDYKHRCHIEKNIPIALIFPSRWQDGAESLRMERTSCLWLTYVKGDWYSTSEKCLSARKGMKSVTWGQYVHATCFMKSTLPHPHLWPFVAASTYLPTFECSEFFRPGNCILFWHFQCLFWKKVCKSFLQISFQKFGVSHRKPGTNVVKNYTALLVTFWNSSWHTYEC